MAVIIIYSLKTYIFKMSRLFVKIYSISFCTLVWRKISMSRFGPAYLLSNVLVIFHDIWDIIFSGLPRFPFFYSMNQCYDSQPQFLHDFIHYFTIKFPDDHSTVSGSALCLIWPNVFVKLYILIIVARSWDTQYIIMIFNFLAQVSIHTNEIVIVFILNNFYTFSSSIPAAPHAVVIEASCRWPKKGVEIGSD